MKQSNRRNPFNPPVFFSNPRLRGQCDPPQFPSKFTRPNFNTDSCRDGSSPLQALITDSALAHRHSAATSSPTFATGSSKMSVRRSGHVGQGTRRVPTLARAQHTLEHIMSTQKRAVATRTSSSSWSRLPLRSLRPGKRSPSGTT